MSGGDILRPEQLGVPVVPEPVAVYLGNRIDPELARGVGEALRPIMNGHENGKAVAQTPEEYAATLQLYEQSLAEHERLVREHEAAQAGYQESLKPVEKPVHLPADAEGIVCTGATINGYEGSEFKLSEYLKPEAEDWTAVLETVEGEWWIARPTIGSVPGYFINLNQSQKNDELDGILLPENAPADAINFRFGQPWSVNYKANGSTHTLDVGSIGQVTVLTEKTHQDDSPELPDDSQPGSDRLAYAVGALKIWEYEAVHGKGSAEANRRNRQKPGAGSTTVARPENSLNLKVEFKAADEPAVTKINAVETVKAAPVQQEITGSNVPKPVAAEPKPASEQVPVAETTPENQSQDPNRDEANTQPAATLLEALLDKAKLRLKSIEIDDVINETAKFINKSVYYAGALYGKVNSKAAKWAKDAKALIDYGVVTVISYFNSKSEPRREDVTPKEELDYLEQLIRESEKNTNGNGNGNGRHEPSLNGHKKGWRKLLGRTA